MIYSEVQLKFDCGLYDKASSFMLVLLYKTSKQGGSFQVSILSPTTALPDANGRTHSCPLIVRLLIAVILTILNYFQKKCQYLTVMYVLHKFQIVLKFRRKSLKLIKILIRTFYSSVASIKIIVIVIVVCVQVK